MNIKTLVKLSLFSLVLAGCFHTTSTTTEEVTVGQEEDKMDKSDMMEETAFTLDEVAEHNSTGNCWLAIEDLVYDVTEFVAKHPGGEAILEGCGTDATELFNTRPMGSGTPHSSKARDMLKDYFIGKLGE